MASFVGGTTLKDSRFAQTIGYRTTDSDIDSHERSFDVSLRDLVERVYHEAVRHQRTRCRLSLVTGPTTRQFTASIKPTSHGNEIEPT